MVTFGFEVEFIIPDEQVPIYKEFMEDAHRCAPYISDMDIGRDCHHLVEGKTHKLSLEEFNWSSLDRLRNNVLSMMDDIGLSYTYYGTHFSAWNFCEKDLIRCVDINEFDEFDQYAVVIFKNHKDNVYIDPFVNNRDKNHSIVMIQRSNLPEDLLNRKVNYGSYQAMLNMISKGSMKELLSWRPVPGGSLRISKASRLELVLGWLPRSTEELLIDYLKEAIGPNKRSKILHGDYVPIFSFKGKYGFSYLSGITYPEDEYQKLPLSPINQKLAGSVIRFFDIL